MVGVSDSTDAGPPEEAPPSPSGPRGAAAPPGSNAEWTFPAEPDAVAGARAVVRGTLREWGLETMGDMTALLVSELVTNALRHASGPIGLRMERDRAADALLVEVSDPLPDPPRERAVGVDDESGRGLQLVAGSARRWGTRRGRTGKTVWFELPLMG
ncbi:ATP-binding protein [Streptomyces meridianus]|uniref:ATP-binding protein n=1 Tax=Streptomyces meridianus TaxID=2938945 RepID=A0ABT0X2U5_9ACTN|nr:ATP-binding protein [Streptomyces meridianus]MCM2576243.1 ATP-binding protein [Streptomyces meridianus]